MGEIDRMWGAKAGPHSGRQSFFTLKIVSDIKTNNSTGLYQRSQII